MIGHIGVRGMRTSAFRALVAMSALYSGQALASAHIEDAIADVVVWVVVIFVPIVGIAVFWLVHIWPERVAEQKHHSQAAAIQALCLLSLVFGGLLWPLAMLWAYMKPMEFKLVHDDEEGGPNAKLTRAPSAGRTEASLREQVAALQKRLDALDAPGAPTSTG